MQASSSRAQLLDWLATGRALMRARRYAEAGVLFDRALAEAPDDPQVQSLAVTAEFWRRLAREGDGFGPVTPIVPRAPSGVP